MSGTTAQRREQRARARLRPYDAAYTWHGTVGGYSNHCCRCDPCKKAYKAYNDEWRKRPEVAERRRRNARELARLPQNVLKRKAWQYGLDVETLESYLEEGICFACGKQDERTLNVDHDHTCCENRRRSCGDCVRGLLCQECNKVLGMVEDDREHLRRLVAYLDRWEARCASE